MVRNLLTCIGIGYKTSGVILRLSSRDEDVTKILWRIDDIAGFYQSGQYGKYAGKEIENSIRISASGAEYKIDAHT